MSTPTLLEAELARFPPISSTQDGGNTTIRKVIIDHNYAFITQLRTWLKGTAYVDEEDGRIVRLLPWKDPDDFTKRVVRVDDMGQGYRGRFEVEEDPDASDEPMRTGFDPKNWILTVHFSTLPYSVGPFQVDPDDPTRNTILGNSPDADDTEATRYCSKTIRQGRIMVVPPIGSLWLATENGRKVIPEAAAALVPVPYKEIVVTWHGVPIDAVPFDAINDCIGKVNGDPTIADPTTLTPYPLTLTDLPDGKSEYASETMNLEDARYLPMRFADGGRGVDIEYYFRERSGTAPGPTTINWNTSPASDGRFYRVYRGDALTNFTPHFFRKDFKVLFQSRALV